MQPHRACKPRRQCWAPTPAHPRSQHVGNGPSQPAQRAGNRGRGSGRPQTPLTTANGAPPGDALPPPHSAQRRPARAHAVGPVQGPHAHTNRARETRVTEPRLPALEDRRPRGGGASHQTPLTTVAGYPPGGGPPPTPRHAAPTGHASQGDSVGTPHPHAGAHSKWIADPDSPPRGRAAEGGGAPDLRRPPQRRKAPPRGRPPATPQRATPARKGARCRAGAGSPRPHHPQPGHTGHGTLAARPRGGAAGGGTAPDTRRPSERWRATPPGGSPPPPPRHAAATGQAGQGDSAGPPHPHTRAHSTWVAEPDSPPRERAAGRGGAPDLRRPSQRQMVPPRRRPSATPTTRNAGPQGRKLSGRCWVPTPAPAAPGTHELRNFAARPRGRAAGGGEAPDLRRPSQWRKAPPPGKPFRHLHSAQRRPSRVHAGAWSPRPHQPHPGHTGGGTPAARPRGRAAGGGTAPDTRRPSQRWQATPPGDGPPPPPWHAAPTRHGSQGDSAGPPLTRTPAPTAHG